MRRLLLVSLVTAATLLALGSTPASAHGWYGYGYGGRGYYAPRFYSYYRPVFRPRFVYGGFYRPRFVYGGFYRPRFVYGGFYRPRFAYGGFYRPRVWGWAGRGWRRW